MTAFDFRQVSAKQELCLPYSLGFYIRNSHGPFKILWCFFIKLFYFETLFQRQILAILKRKFCCRPQGSNPSPSSFEAKSVTMSYWNYPKQTLHFNSSLMMQFCRNSDAIPSITVSINIQIFQLIKYGVCTNYENLTLSHRYFLKYLSNNRFVLTFLHLNTFRFLTMEEHTKIQLEYVNVGDPVIKLYK